MFHVLDRAATVIGKADIHTAQMQIDQKSINIEASIGDQIFCHAA
jgi:hypothetical protein